jgi:mannose-1-phosphate guanylyltransferase
MNREEGSWVIVLAGGEGERLRPFVERWVGRHKPKQYCCFPEMMSLFERYAASIGTPEAGARS